jgi:membrane-bound serine protease (ClpP class)
VIIDMDTPGGRLLETEEIIAWMRSLDKDVYVHVNEHAQSAGAIICLASDGIYMAPGSRIGSAMPILAPAGVPMDLPAGVREKLMSDTRAMVRGLAQENDYIPELAVAMVDDEEEVIVGDRVVSEKGKLLNLTAEEAVEVIPPRQEPLLAQAIVPDLDGVMKKTGLENLQVMRMQPMGAEGVAVWLVRLAPLLLTLALIGIFIEIKTPGFGVPGVIGFAAMCLFVFGHFVAGMTGAMDVMLIVAGFVLIGVELLVLPGFGVAGALGIFALLAGLLLAMVPMMPGDMPGIPGAPGNFTFESFVSKATMNLAATFAITGAGVWALSKILPKTSVYDKFILQTTASVESGYIAADIVENNKLLGQEGRTLTPLRPAGTARIGDKRIDVVSLGDFIEKDEPVRVKEVHGSRIVVVRINSGGGSSDAE